MECGGFTGGLNAGGARTPAACRFQSLCLAKILSGREINSLRHWKDLWAVAPAATAVSFLENIPLQAAGPSTVVNEKTSFGLPPGKCDDVGGVVPRSIPIDLICMAMILVWLCPTIITRVASLGGGRVHYRNFTS